MLSCRTGAPCAGSGYFATCDPLCVVLPLVADITSCLLSRELLLHTLALTKV